MLRCRNPNEEVPAVCFPDADYVRAKREIVLVMTRMRIVHRAQSNEYRMVLRLDVGVSNRVLRIVGDVIVVLHRQGVPIRSIGHELASRQVVRNEPIHRIWEGRDVVVVGSGEEEKGVEPIPGEEGRVAQEAGSGTGIRVLEQEPADSRLEVRRSRIATSQDEDRMRHDKTLRTLIELLSKRRQRAPRLVDS